ncbi:GAF domain-containing protein [Herpetosiphon gulosus]|uniref:Regulator of RpoS n=1 Tax=Herpetosiphon gulosus TaxID=1973496 RepID=A0ABP9X0N0_9CHLR
MPDASNGHVLIVEDDLSISRMFQLLLRDAGYRVSLANSSEEALQFVRVITPDIILLDISLPGMNGVDLTRHLRSNPAIPFIPIIQITALGDLRTKVAALDAGADDILVKPIELSELLARLRVMLRLQKNRRGLEESTRQMHILYAISQTLNSSLDINSILRDLVLQLANALGAVRTSIILVNDHNTPFYASSVKETLNTESIQRVIRDGVAGWVMRAMKPLIIADTARDPRWISLDRRTETTRSILSVPLIHQGIVVGVVTAAHTRTNYFTQEHLELAQNIGNQSVTAFNHAQLFQTTVQQKSLLERRSQMLEELLNVGERLSLNLPLQDVLNELAQAIHRSLGFRQVIIHVFGIDDVEPAQGVAGVQREQIQQLWTNAQIQQSIVPLLRERFRISRSYFVPSGYKLDDEETNQLPFGAIGIRQADYLFVPLGSPQQLLGLMIVDLPNNLITPDLATIQALEVFANHGTTAVNNNRLFAREHTRANQLQLLVELGRNFAELMTPDQLLRLVASLVRHSFGFNSVAILLKHNNEFMLRAGTHNFAHNPYNQPLSIDARILQALEHYQSWLSNNSEQFCLNYEWGEPTIVAELIVPLHTHEGIQGLLVIGHSDPSALDGLTQSILGAIAVQLTVGLDNAKLFLREQEYIQQLNRVNDIALQLTSTTTEPAFHEIMQQVAAMFQAPQSMLVLVDPDQRQITRSIAYPQSWLHELPALPELLASLDESRVQMLNHQHASALGEVLRQAEVNTVVVAQLYSAERLQGLLLIKPADMHYVWRSNDRNLLQTLATLFAQALENQQLQAQRLERLRADLQRYMAPPLVEQLLSEGGFGEASERDIVVLFADLRGFTALSENLAPQVVVKQILNRFFDEMTAVLYRYDAIIDKFLGDGLMAVFGSVRPLPNDAERAMNAAIDMQQTFAKLQTEWQASFGYAIGLGIGMSCGRAVVGNIGSAQRMDYTVIGDVVNTASRLVGIAEAGQIIITQPLAQRLKRHKRQLEELEPVQLKGKRELQAIYAIRKSR